MSKKSKKPTKESIKLDEFLTNLTEVELETESKTIFSLCETARNVDFYKIEGAILDSFIEWARSESGKFKRGATDLDNGEGQTIESVQNTPYSEDIIPVEPTQEKLMILKSAVTNRGIGRGCNDLRPEEKELLTPKEWVWLCKLYHDWNGDPKDFDPKYPVMFDFMVISFLDYYFYGVVHSTKG